MHGIRYPKETYELVKFLEHIYIRNKKTNNNAILRKFLTMCYILCKIIIIVFALTATAFICLPIVLFVTTGEMVPSINLYIPGLDSETSTGFIILCCYHLVLMLMAFFGTCGFDLLFIMLVLHLWPLTEIFAGQVDQLNKTLRNRQNCSQKQQKIQLRNVMQMHRDLYAYVGRIVEMYWLVCSVELYTNAFSMCLLIYLIMMVCKSFQFFF